MQTRGAKGLNATSKGAIQCRTPMSAGAFVARFRHSNPGKVGPQVCTEGRQQTRNEVRYPSQGNPPRLTQNPTGAPFPRKTVFQCVFLSGSLFGGRELLAPHRNNGPRFSFPSGRSCVRLAEPRAPERAELLQKWGAWKRVAVVLLGEPPASFKAFSQARRSRCFERGESGKPIGVLFWLCCYKNRGRFLVYLVVASSTRASYFS